MTPPMTVRELLAQWMRSDAEMVDSINEAFASARPPVDVELAFVQQRLNHMATALATLMNLLSQSDGK